MFANKGQRTFDKCNNKVIEIKDFVYDVTEVEIEPKPLGDSDDSDDQEQKVSEPETKTIRTMIYTADPSSDSRQYAGSAAVLHCPRTEDPRVDIASQYSNHSSRLVAYDSVRRIAGRIVCDGCIYATMTPVEVAQERAARLRAEAEQLSAIAVREQALAELREIHPNFQLPHTGETAGETPQL